MRAFEWLAHAEVDSNWRATRSCHCQSKVAEHGSWSVLIESHIAYTDRALLLIGPGMTLEIIVEGVVTAIEILHLIVFFEAANDNGHSVQHGPNQCVGWAVRFPCGNEFRKTF